MDAFSLKACYATAWKAFSKWWIPLCLISSLLLFFEIAPRFMVHAEKQQIISKGTALFYALAQNDTASINQLAVELNETIISFLITLLKLSAVIFPFAALVTILLLMYSNIAVKNRKNKRSFGALLHITFAHIAIAFIKALAFLFFFFPGFYVYVKLFFVSLVMLEEKKGLRAAMRRSREITKGNFCPLFLLIACNTILQAASLVTIIGFIPATGFANTARAAAYHQLKNKTL